MQSLSKLNGWLPVTFQNAKVSRHHITKKKPDYVISDYIQSKKVMVENFYKPISKTIALTETEDERQTI